MEEDFSLSFPEWQANTFSVDCTGRRAVLAVQKLLVVVSLEQSKSDGEVKALRKLAKQNKYEIKAVLWNPHHSQQDLLASTCQQRLEVWNVRAERHPLVYSIKAHTRPVSDLSWSFTDPNLLASCAVDSFVHIWDIRETRRPKTSFKAVAGASLVQWNRVNDNILASAHDSDIRIWDMRKPTTASGYISAHMTRVHDIDWSYTDERRLTTCSHDYSIKFWDISSTRVPEGVIKASQQPVWRARNYPPGYAVAMVLVPAMHGGDNRVFLWDSRNESTPAHVFIGHSEPVLEVQWRKYRGEYQLVSWARDKCLRVWGLSEQLQEELGVEPLDPMLSVDSVTTLSSLDSTNTLTEGDMGTNNATMSLDLSQQTNMAATNSPSLTRSLPPSMIQDQSALRSPQQVFQPQHTLAQEFSLLNVDNLSNLEMETLDASQRSCTVKLQQGGHIVQIGITFPSHYPNGAAPSFTLDRTSTIDVSTQHELLKIVNETALTHVKVNRPCLEPCLRKMSKTLESFVSRPQPPSKPPDFNMPFGHLDDEHIPFPRTSGARFCSNDILVCFSIPPALVLPPNVTKTPRSLDKMNVYRSYINQSARGQQRRTTSYLSSSLPKRGSGGNLVAIAGREKQGGGGKVFQESKDLFSNPYTGTVTIRSVTNMLPVDYHLATAYRLTESTIKDVCEENATAAEQHGRADLVQVWSLAALIADVEMTVPQSPEDGVPWSQHPFGRQLIHSLFSHYAKLHDVQTLAMLACVFQMHCQQYERLRPLPPSLVNGTQKPSPTKRSSVGEKFASSWKDEEDSVYQDEATLHRQNSRLLDDLLTQQCDEFRRCYGNILYSWGMLDQRAEVLKFQSDNKDKQMEIGFGNYCKHCSDVVIGPSCAKSKCFSFKCSICNLSVRGSANFCQACGHGGHALHTLEWFKKYSFCPSGCGCPCLEVSGWT